jgi:hypothetical protein
LAGFLGSRLFGWNFYVTFFAACSAACFTDKFTAAEAFVAFDGHDAATVANIALQHALLGTELPCAFAFVAFGGDRTGALAFRAINFAFTITSCTNQNRKPQSDLSSQQAQKGYAVNAFESSANFRTTKGVASETVSWRVSGWVRAFLLQVHDVGGPWLSIALRFGASFA